jgi:hypothetical protein
MSSGPKLVLRQWLSSRSPLFTSSLDSDWNVKRGFIVVYAFLRQLELVAKSLLLIAEDVKIILSLKTSVPAFSRPSGLLGAAVSVFNLKFPVLPTKSHQQLMALDWRGGVLFFVFRFPMRLDPLAADSSVHKWHREPMMQYSPGQILLCT